MTTYDLVLAAMFTALIAALGVMPGIPIPFLPVPITLQFMGVMLAGALLGPWRAAASVVLLIALVAMGAPVLAGGRGGLPILGRETAGFIYGWVPAAFVTGLIAQRFARAGGGMTWPAIAGHVVACIAAIPVDYVCAIAWLVAVAGLAPTSVALGMLAFVPGDLVKAVVAGWAAVSIRRVHPIEPR